MRTIKVCRQGFPVIGMNGWINFFVFVLSKKYNVLLDSQDPDLVIYSNLNSRGDFDHYMQSPVVNYPLSDKNKKFLFISGEVASFSSVVDSHENAWAIGYEKFSHERFLRMPSYVIDAWVLFDEARLFDTPFSWLTEKRNIVKRDGFCSVVQRSESKLRENIFDTLQQYKKVTSPGPWRQNTESLNPNKWVKKEYFSRVDGLVYRDKINFFRKFKFNIAVHYTNTPFIVQEKLLHAWAGGAIPIFYGNEYIEDEGFNPTVFINMHKESLDSMLERVKRLDSDKSMYIKATTEPLFTDNRLPEYFNIDRTLAFLEDIIES